MTNNRNREEEGINSAFGQGIKAVRDAQLGMRLKGEERSINERREEGGGFPGRARVWTPECAWLAQGSIRCLT